MLFRSMAGAGSPDGVYDLGGNAVTVAGGKAVLSDGTLAGSVLTMAQAVRNVREWIPQVNTLNAIAQLSATNAAEALGFPAKGALKHGYDADFVLLDRDFTVDATYIGGRCVYRSPTP